MSYRISTILPLSRFISARGLLKFTADLKVGSRVRERERGIFIGCKFPNAPWWHVKNHYSVEVTRVRCTIEKRKRERRRGQCGYREEGDRKRVKTTFYFP